MSSLYERVVGGGGLTVGGRRGGESSEGDDRLEHGGGRRGGSWGLGLPSFKILRGLLYFAAGQRVEPAIPLSFLDSSSARRCRNGCPGLNCPGWSSAQCYLPSDTLLRVLVSHPKQVVPRIAIAFPLAFPRSRRRHLERAMRISLLPDFSARRLDNEAFTPISPWLSLRQVTLTAFTESVVACPTREVVPRCNHRFIRMCTEASLPRARSCGAPARCRDLEKQCSLSISASHARIGRPNRRTQTCLETKSSDTGPHCSKLGYCICGYYPTFWWTLLVSVSVLEDRCRKSLFQRGVFVREPIVAKLQSMSLLIFGASAKG